MYVQSNGGGRGPRHSVQWQCRTGSVPPASKWTQPTTRVGHFLISFSQGWLTSSCTTVLRETPRETCISHLPFDLHRSSNSTASGNSVKEPKKMEGETLPTPSRSTGRANSRLCMYALAGHARYSPIKRNSYVCTGGRRNRSARPVFVVPAVLFPVVAPSLPTWTPRQSLFFLPRIITALVWP